MYRCAEYDKVIGVKVAVTGGLVNNRYLDDDEIHKPHCEEHSKKASEGFACNAEYNYKHAEQKQTVGNVIMPRECKAQDNTCQKQYRGGYDPAFLHSDSTSHNS